MDVPQGAHGRARGTAGVVVMPKRRQYAKHIACLDHAWSRENGHPLTARALLELVTGYHGIRLAYRCWHTSEELAEGIAALAALPRRPAYRILYLAAHGKPGGFNAGRTWWGLEDVAAHMERAFAGWIVHFDACQTLEVRPAALERFLAATGAAAVSGFRREVDWLESASLDQLYLYWLQREPDFRSLPALLAAFAAAYPDLVRRTGFRYATPGRALAQGSRAAAARLTGRA